MEQEARHPLDEGSAGDGTREAPQNPIFAIALAACIGCMLLALASLNQQQIVGWVVEDPEEVRTRLRVVLAVLATFGVLPVALMSFFAGRMSMAVTRTGRYPPPGVRLGRREAVRVGGEAFRAARVLRLVSLVLGAITLAIPAIFWMVGAALTPH